MRSYSCPSCGAELICDETTAATSCPYCGNPTVIGGQFSGSQKPELVLPFVLDKNAAKSALKAFYKGKKFLPNAFIAQNHIEEIQGVYVPFWLFDADAEGEGHYEGLRSEEHREGDYVVTTTEHFDVFRAGSTQFNKVPVDASTKMPDGHMDAIEPFDYQGLQPFSAAFLPGYLADRYDVDADISSTRTRQRMENTVRGGTAGHRQRLHQRERFGRKSERADDRRTVCPAACLDVAHQVARQGFSLCHEWADRQAGGRPARG